MCEILIFGGTMEGRMLAESCARSGIPAEVRVVSQTGEDLIEAREGLSIHVGGLDGAQMQAVLAAHPYRLVVDATHPYAREATKNIREACSLTQTPYLRVRRESEPVEGPSFETLDEMIAYLNACSGAGTVLSSLGGKSLAALRAVRDYEKRVWARVLPAEGILAQAVSLGFPAEHIILGKGPFSVLQNITHLRLSGAVYLLTKESGKTGGYPEKIQAAAECGVTVLTIRREMEEGVSVSDALQRIAACAGGKTDGAD